MFHLWITFLSPPSTSFFRPLEKLQTIEQQLDLKNSDLHQQISSHRATCAKLQKALEKYREKLENLARPLEVQQSQRMKLDEQIKELETFAESHSTLRTLLNQDMDEFFSFFVHYKRQKNFHESLRLLQELMELFKVTTHIRYKTKEEYDTLIKLAGKVPEVSKRIAGWKSLRIDKYKGKLERFKANLTQLLKKMAPSQKECDHLSEELMKTQDALNSYQEEITQLETLVSQISLIRKMVTLLYEEGSSDLSFKREFIQEFLAFSLSQSSLSKLLQLDLDLLDVLMKRFGQQKEQIDLGLLLLERFPEETFYSIAEHTSSLSLRIFLSEHPELPDGLLRILHWNISDDEKENELRKMLGQSVATPAAPAKNESDEAFFRGMKMLYVAGGDPGITSSIVEAMEKVGIDVRVCEPSRRDACLESYDYVVFHMAAGDHGSYYYYKGALKDAPERGIYLPLKVRQSTILPFLREKITLRTQQKMEAEA